MTPLSNKKTLALLAKKLRSTLSEVNSPFQLQANKKAIPVTRNGF
jgi:hypothetical protein